MINRHFFLSGNVISYLIICLPLALISGPFVPDIFITISSLFLLLQIYYNLKIFNLQNNIKIFIILFYIYLLLNLFITKSYNYSISASIFFLRFILLVFVIEYFCINSNKFKIYFFYILFFSLLIVILDGYFQFFFKQNILGFQQYCVRDCNENEELRSMRLTGLLNKPIIGSYIARLIPLLFGLFFLLKLKKINRFKDLFIVILSILATGLVFLSGERTSFALILGFFLIVLFITNYSRKFKFFISTGIIFIIFLTTIFSESTKFRMVTFTFMQVGIKVEKYSFFNDSNYKKFILVRDSMIKSEDNKLFIFSNHHHSHISTAFLIFKDNLVFGTGMKSFRYVCKKYRINDDSCTTHPHNLVLQFLSELGIIGFLFYLVSFIFFGLFLIKKIIQKNINNIQNAQICFGAGIFMSLFPLIPSGNFFNNWLSIIFYLTLGFFIYTRIEEKNG